MGVYIPSMKMPDKCGECKMHFLSNFPQSYVCCQITDRIPKIVEKYIDSKTDLDVRKSSIMAVKRPNWCPLVEVPVPHGRLIDADALRHSLIKRWRESENDNENYKFAFEDADEVVRKAQTVYPASADLYRNRCASLKEV